MIHGFIIQHLVFSQRLTIVQTFHLSPDPDTHTPPSYLPITHTHPHTQRQCFFSERAADIWKHKSHQDVSNFMYFSHPSSLYRAHSLTCIALFYFFLPVFQPVSWSFFGLVVLTIVTVTASLVLSLSSSRHPLQKLSLDVRLNGKQQFGVWLRQKRDELFLKTKLIKKNQ